MNKSTKGALAAAAAGVLLLGGAGTLAFWTDTESTPGVTINTGHLDLTDLDCGTGWELDGGTAYTSQLLVPGDTLTKTCTATLDIAGTHFTQADFDVTVPSDLTGNAALLDELSTPVIDVTLNDVAQPDATNVPVADGDEVEVAITIEWPYGVEDNGANVVGGVSATLDQVEIKVTQNHDA
jgi:alternate signal-mediated exported protein